MLFEAIATLTGTIIGAGVLGIPYAISKSGFLIGFFWLSTLYILMLLLHLMIGEITLRDTDVHQLPGYAKKYLGNVGYFLMLISSLIGMYGAVIAYLLAQSKSLNLLFGINQALVIVALAGIVSIFCWFGLNIIKYIESGISLLVYILLIGAPLALLTVFKPDFSRLFVLNFDKFFYPIGSIVFAYIGFVAIPEVREILYRKEKLMKKAITIGVTIPFILYTIFALSIILTVKNVPEIATYIFSSFGYLFTIILTLPPFFTISFGIESIYRYDLRLPKTISHILTFLPPTLIALLIYSQSESFIRTISMAGALSFMITGPLLVLMHQISKIKTERRPEYSINIPKPLQIVLILIFIIAPLLEILNVD